MTDLVSGSLSAGSASSQSLQLFSSQLHSTDSTGNNNQNILTDFDPSPSDPGLRLVRMNSFHLFADTINDAVVGQGKKYVDDENVKFVLSLLKYGVSTMSKFVSDKRKLLLESEFGVDRGSLNFMDGETSIHVFIDLLNLGKSLIKWVVNNRYLGVGKTSYIGKHLYWIIGVINTVNAGKEIFKVFDDIDANNQQMNENQDNPGLQLMLSFGYTSSVYEHGIKSVDKMIDSIRAFLVYNGNSDAADEIKK